MKGYRWIFIVGLLLFFLMLFSKFNKVTISPLDDTGLVKITINFYIPVQQENIDAKVKLVSEKPNAIITKTCRWKDNKTLEIFAGEKESPKGFNIRLNVGPVKTVVPGFYKKVNIKYKAEIKPLLTGISPIVPSNGPIILNFSKPVSKLDLKKGLKMDFDYELNPSYTLYDNGKLFKDLSQWEIVPKKKLFPGREYVLKFAGQFANSPMEFHKTFRAANIPIVVSTGPLEGEKDVKLYQPIEISFTEEMEEVDVKISNMLGDVTVEGKKAVFKPHTVFLPDSTYNVKVTGKSILGEEMRPYIFDFSTVDMGDKWWVEINLRPLQKVIVYRGKKVIRSMVTSGGLPEPDNRTPLGFFTLKDKGEYFWTERISEGGLYWVRITGNYLIHSVPRDKDNKIIEKEFVKLGIPASHGCIRLKDENAKWFYETVPSGTLVIIHD